MNLRHKLFRIYDRFIRRGPVALKSQSGWMSMGQRSELENLRMDLCTLKRGTISTSLTISPSRGTTRKLQQHTLKISVLLEIIWLSMMGQFLSSSSRDSRTASRQRSKITESYLQTRYFAIKLTEFRELIFQRDRLMIFQLFRLKIKRT